ncbi:MAG: hypothetical protein AAGL49_04015 [Pseudomonadota bacterium]
MMRGADFIRAFTLPPDMEAALYRATAGEQVRWSGRSSGIAERAQGAMLMAVGVIVAVINVGPALELWLNPDAGGEEARLIAGLSALFFLLGGGALAVYGWRFYRSATRIVWAVTNKRLWRIVVDGVQAPKSAQAWTKAEILKVEKLTWRNGRTGLAVTVAGRGESDPTLFIIGPSDIEAAERALSQMED